jgi:hypothetical protein
MSQQAATGEAQAEAAAAASGSAPPAASEQQEQEDSLLGQQRFATTGFQHAGWLAKATYTFVAPLLRRGAQNKVRCAIWVMRGAAAWPAAAPLLCAMPWFPAALLRMGCMPRVVCRR